MLLFLEKYVMPHGNHYLISNCNFWTCNFYNGAGELFTGIPAKTGGLTNGETGCLLLSPQYFSLTGNFLEN
jgi:hypothetical protein